MIIFSALLRKERERGNKVMAAINIEDITTEEIWESNRLKQEACESIKEALKVKLSADDMTVEWFERIFWNDTQGYLFRREGVR